MEQKPQLVNRRSRMVFTSTCFHHKVPIEELENPVRDGHGDACGCAELVYTSLVIWDEG